MSLFTGCGVAMITPFDKNGEVDYGALERIIELQIEGGTSAIIPLGTTGEPSTLSNAERDAVTKFVIEKVNRRVPVIVGAGANNTVVASELSQKAEKAGADGLLIVTPYYNKCTQRGIVEHYKYIAARTGLPIFVYNVPSRTNVNIEADTARTLSEIKNVVAIKEACGDLAKVTELAKTLADCDMDLCMGDDGSTAIGMMLGAKGLISVAANAIPKSMSKLCALCLDGDFIKARDLQFALHDFIQALFIEVSPIPVKYVMSLLGLDSGVPRLPLTKIEPAHAAILKSAFEKIK